uniref:Uncharacterized protein n=1 Tax=Haemonchus contortus TaxID=6289 RepID=A0A7I5ECU0_HAECO
MSVMGKIINPFNASVGEYNFAWHEDQRAALKGPQGPIHDPNTEKIILWIRLVGAGVLVIICLVGLAIYLKYLCCHRRREEDELLEIDD